VGLGPSPVVRLEGALAHDDSAVTRGQRLRAATNERRCTELPRLHRQERVEPGSSPPAAMFHLSRQMSSAGRLVPGDSPHLPCGEPRRIALALLASCATGPSPRPSRATWPVQDGRRFSARPSAAWRRGAPTPRWRQHVHAQTVDERVENGPPPGRSPHRRSEGAL